MKMPEKKRDTEILLPGVGNNLKKCTRIIAKSLKEEPETPKKERIKMLPATKNLIIPIISVVSAAILIMLGTVTLWEIFSKGIREEVTETRITLSKAIQENHTELSREIIDTRLDLGKEIQENHIATYKDLIKIQMMQLEIQAENHKMYQELKAENQMIRLESKEDINALRLEMRDGFDNLENLLAKSIEDGNPPPKKR